MKHKDKVHGISLVDLLPTNFNEAVSPKGWNMSKKFVTVLSREVKNLQKYHRQQNEEDFLEVANYMELQLKYMKKNLKESVNEGNKSFGVYKWVGSAGKVVGMYNTANGARSQIAKMEKKDPKGKYQLIKFESINEGKLKLTKDKPKKITQRIWSAPKRIMTKSAYLRMPDMNKKRRDGVDYVATSIGPKKTQVYIPVVFESVNEGTCGYGIDGKIGEEPAGPNLMKKIKKISKDKEKKKILKSKKEGMNEAGMELKKLEDAIKMFQKKIDKQGRVTNARDEDHLKNLIKIYKQMGGKKIKESVNERLNQSQAKTLLRQLGGNKFIMMTGAKQMSIGKDGLTMKIGRNSKSITHVAIDLDRGKDLYTMKFIRVRKGIPKVVKKYDSIYADNLNNIFEKETGLYTRL